jgi:hypothetical protein
MKILPAIISCASLIVLSSSADAQSLVGTGSLATESLVRTRRIDAQQSAISEKGDVITVIAQQPAGNKGFTISAHPQYREKGDWQPVPMPKHPLAAWYTSKKYGGLRDYVDVGPTTVDTRRIVSLFVPVDGFAMLAGKECDLRYVLHVWDADDREIASLMLDPYRIQVGVDNGHIAVSIIDRGAKHAAEAHGTSELLLFDTANGKWRVSNSSAQGSSVKR